ncbi:MAG: CBS domain-containing protein [Candidatus Heimdallarchaeota archaeon]|nr:CBS domain-containing protein [Candidatus Heimdallarchaeota archaeon]
MKPDINRLFQKAKSLTAIDFPLREITPIREETPLLEIIDHLSTTDLPIISVINKKNQYIGIITLQNLLFIFKRKHTSLHEAFTLQYMTEGYNAGELVNINLPIIYDNDSLEKITEYMDKFHSLVLPRASNRNEQITGFIYLKDIITEFRNIFRKMKTEEGEPCE